MMKQILYVLHKINEANLRYNYSYNWATQLIRHMLKTQMNNLLEK